MVYPSQILSGEILPGAQIGSKLYEASFPDLKMKNRRPGRRRPVLPIWLVVCPQPPLQLQRLWDRRRLQHHPPPMVQLPVCFLLPRNKLEPAVLIGRGAERALLLIKAKPRPALKLAGSASREQRNTLQNRHAQSQPGAAALCPEAGHQCLAGHLVKLTGHTAGSRALGLGARLCDRHPVSIHWLSLELPGWGQEIGGVQ